MPLFLRGVHVDLNLVQIVFDVETDNAAAQAAYYYQALRRFDLFFRQACCRSLGTQCSVCKEQAACPYREVFAQELSTDPDIVRRHQKPPLPFAFKPRGHRRPPRRSLDRCATPGSALSTPNADPTIPPRRREPVPKPQRRPSPGGRYAG